MDKKDIYLTLLIILVICILLKSILNFGNWLSDYLVWQFTILGG